MKGSGRGGRGSGGQNTKVSVNGHFEQVSMQRREILGVGRVIVSKSTHSKMQPTNVSCHLRRTSEMRREKNKREIFESLV